MELSRDDKYMALAFCIANIFSKDPNTKIGSVIVSPANEPLGFGYNGPPRSFNDEEVDWDDRPSKNSKIIHSELNSIFHAQKSGLSLDGATLYVNAPPCPRCILHISAVGIKRVVYYNMKTDAASSINLTSFEETAKLAKMGNVELVEYKPKQSAAHTIYNSLRLTTKTFEPCF